MIGLITGLGALLIASTLYIIFSNKSVATRADKLSSNGKTIVRVMKQGKLPLVNMPASDITDGDILALKAGDPVPVTGLLTFAKDGSVEFERLSPTGRPYLVIKYPAEDLPSASTENVVMSGSRVHKGEGLLWVLTETPIAEDSETQRHQTTVPGGVTPEKELPSSENDDDSNLKKDQSPLPPRTSEPARTVEEPELPTVQPDFKAQKSRRTQRRARVKGTGAVESDVGHKNITDTINKHIETAAIESSTELNATIGNNRECQPKDTTCDADSRSSASEFDDPNPEDESRILLASRPPLGTSLDLSKTNGPESDNSPPVMEGSHQISSPSPSFTQQRALRVPGVLEGVPASGIPDFGSSFDIVSLEFLTKNNWVADPEAEGRKLSYSLPDGKVKSFVGTITLRWRFEGESQPWVRTFHILRGSIYPLLFGRDFLNKTDTMTRSRNRIKQVLINVSSAFHRVLYVDHMQAIAASPERILGLVNCKPIFGFADTCSDIPIIKRKIARELGFEILEGPEHVTRVQFIDGSTALTTGTVKNAKWCFGVTSAPEDTRLIENLHVMDDIPCALILDTWTLWDSDAFGRYRQDFRYDVVVNSQPQGEKFESGAVCVIKVEKNGVPAADANETTDSVSASEMIKDADKQAEEEERAFLAQMVAKKKQGLNGNGANTQNGNATNPHNNNQRVSGPSNAASGAVAPRTERGWNTWLSKRRRRKRQGQTS